MRLLAFDCDGTILDTREDYAAAINHTLERFAKPTISLEDVTAFLGYGTDYLVRKSLERVGASEIFAAFKPVYLERYFSHLCIRTHAYPRIEEFLSRAAALGYRLAVISNKPDYAVNQLMQRCFPTIPFSCVKGQAPTEQPKPHPELMEKVLAQLDLRPEDVTYFGDTEVDAMFARNSHLGQLYMVTWGFRAPGELRARLAQEDIEPARYLSAPDELFDLI